MAMNAGDTVIYKGKKVLIERIDTMPMARVVDEKGKTKLIPWVALIAGYLENENT